jgi:hypothetical protein
MTATASPTPTVELAPTAVWMFASEPPTVAHLFQTYIYTVTFALAEEPGDADATPVAEELDEAPVAAKETLEERPTIEPIEEPDAKASPASKTEAETEEAISLADDDEVEAATEVAEEDELPAPPEIESLPFAIAAQGALTVEAPVLPTWLALTLLDSDDVALFGKPREGDEGEHFVELIATDAAGAVITQSFTVTVELDPNPFRVEELHFETDEDTPLEGVLAVEHVEGADIFFAVSTEPKNGEIVALDEESGDFTYAPALDFYGEDVFTIEISDAWQRAITTPVTITVNAVNDPPQIELEGVYDDVYTVTVGSSIEISVVVSDVDSDAITVTVENLPPDLIYLDGMIVGVIAAEAADGGEYVTLIVAEDDEGATAERAITWIIEAPTVDADDEQAAAESELPLPNEEAAPGETAPGDESSATAQSITVSTAQATSLPGKHAAWQTPPASEGCPLVKGVLTPASLAEGASLLDDVLFDEPEQAPRLRFAADLTAGDYHLFVCGCAPGYSDGERSSQPVNNQALFAGVDGIVHLAPDEKPIILTGFADFSGFTWQPLTADNDDDTPALITVAADGLHTVDLWMSHDGVLVSAVKLTSAANKDELQAAVGQLCVGAD